MPLLDVRSDHLQIVQDILQRFVPDRETWAFGSRAKWLAKDYSDLDLCVLGEIPLSFRTLGLMAEAFEESDLPYKVDVVDWATTSEGFRKIIERDRVVVQKRNGVSPALPSGEQGWLRNWTTKLFSDIADLNPSRSLKKGTVSPFIEMAALPVNGRDIPVHDVSTRDFSGSGSRFVNGDVLLARITPCLENGKTALVNVLSPSVVGHGSTEFIVLSAKESSDQRFIYYLARHPDFREYAIQHMEGTSGRQRVSATSVGAYRFLCPPSLQRKEIGDTLGALDDKISLLRETNATLEAIAQALFKSWFVDFDPVRAKAEGREPEGMDAATAALFPDSFEESELGLVPRGWSWITLNTAYEINPPRKLKKGEIAPYLDMASVPIAGHCAESVVMREMGSGTKFINGDTLLARITPCLENGKSAFVDFLADDAVGWGSTEFVVLRPKSPLPEFHAYLLCRFPAFREFAVHSMSGTSGRQRIQNDVLGRYPIAVPSESIALAFGSIVEPFQRRIADNHAQSNTLATLRDTLLPRLISGALRIPESVA